jgi:tripartite-type tricarboxylate transporter receptor subunit TctC
MKTPPPLTANRARRRQLLRAASAWGAAALGLPAWSQASGSKYPNRPIRLVVPFAPGGLTDAYARLYAEQLTTALGATVVVDNKPGGGAIIGIDAVAKAPPDGYTLLVTTSGTVWQNRVLYRKLPYNLDTDLVPIVGFPSGPLVVGAAERTGARNWKEFIAWAKVNPAAMGTYAPGSYPHMLADQTNRAEGTSIQSVHYRGESPMWVDVVSGQVPVAVGSYQGFNTISGRGVRAIGVTGPYRSPRLPDVPTLVEQGAEAKLVSLEGVLPVMAPARTPEDILRVLNKAAVDGAESERSARLRENFAIPNKPKNLTETRRDWERDVPTWIKLAVDLGIRLD